MYHLLFGLFIWPRAQGSGIGLDLALKCLASALASSILPRLTSLPGSFWSKVKLKYAKMPKSFFSSNLANGAIYFK